MQGDSLDYELAFVEFDELGWNWEPAQEERAIQLVQARAKETNTIVLVFVHGWHHGTDCCDSNIVCFRTTLAKLRSELEQPRYRVARKLLTGDERVRVVGIYVGWRGRSLPGALDFLTFWSRKSTAERVGHSGLRNFLLRLQSVYVEENQTTGPFLGLVTIGHSFGGQAVYRAVSDLVEGQLVSAEKSPSRTGSLIEGLGDLIVLVNPAVEASSMYQMDAMARQHEFSSDQTPVIAVFSAENDLPRHRLFPLGRFLGNPNPARRSALQRKLDRRSLGVTQLFLSHSLRWNPDMSGRRVTQQSVTGGEDSLMTDGGKTCKLCDWSDLPTHHPTQTPEDTWIPPGQSEPVSLEQLTDFSQIDFGRQIRLVGVEMTPRGEPRPHHPFLVVRSSSEIFSGHSGIFTRRFMTFLSRYLAYIEGKRLQTRGQRIPRVRATEQNR